MAQYFTALGIRCAVFVYDILIAADDAETCAKHIRMVEAIMPWFGLCCADKTVGPAASLEFLGLLFDP